MCIRDSSKDDLHDKAAQAYVKALVHNQSALLVAPTWNEIESVTEKVRAALKMSGRLTGEEKEFQVFDSLSWTEAQKQDARQYRPCLLYTSGILTSIRTKAGRSFFTMATA